MTTALVAVLVLTQRRGSQGHPNMLARLAAAAIVTLIIVHPTVKDIIERCGTPDDLAVLPESCLDTYLSPTDPGGAGEFLQQRQASGPPFRYVGHAGRDPSTDDPSYSSRRCDPGVLAAVSGGRALDLELESIQGYNPLHLGVYTDYSDVMNGGQQDYHWVDHYPATLMDSALLDMLNVRYIVVSLDPPDSQDDARAIGAGKTEVFRNG